MGRADCPLARLPRRVLRAGAFRYALVLTGGPTGAALPNRCAPARCARPCIRKTQSALFERITRVRVAALETAAEPRDALFGRAVCKPIGGDMARLHPLDTVVSDRGGRLEAR